MASSGLIMSMYHELHYWIPSLKLAEMGHLQALRSGMVLDELLGKKVYLSCVDLIIAHNVVSHCSVVLTCLLSSSHGFHQNLKMHLISSVNALKLSGSIPESCRPVIIRANMYCQHDARCSKTGSHNCLQVSGPFL